MQEVHTCILRVVPPPAGVRTVWMFGFQRRLVRRCEWDTLWPKPGPLPQTSHTLATGNSWVYSKTEGAQESAPRQPGKVTRRPAPTANRPHSVRPDAIVRGG